MGDCSAKKKKKTDMEAASRKIHSTIEQLEHRRRELVENETKMVRVVACTGKCKCSTCLTGCDFYAIFQMLKDNFSCVNIFTYAHSKFSF